MRLAFVGDVHGQLRELVRMIERIERRGVDRIVLLGDLVDRGPSSVECVRLARTHAFTARSGSKRPLEMVLGNHEVKSLQARFGRATPGHSGPPPPPSEWILRALDDEDYAFLDSRPSFPRIRDGGLDVAAVHGGIMAGWLDPSGFDATQNFYLARVGYLGRHGEQLSPLGGSPRFWADSCDGRFGRVFFGHTSFPRVRHFAHATGVDTSKDGCLSAIVVSSEPGESDLELRERHLPQVSAWRGA